jgi:hypothetical protein
MTYEESVKKHQWRSVAIHRVISLARASRDFNELVDREFEHCIGGILQATCPDDAKKAMTELRFKVQKYTDYSDFAKHIMTNFTEIV